MPEMHFRVRWPDGGETLCYSPSLVIRDHLAVGQTYALPDFLSRARTALRIASDRVQQKYGMPCSRAIGQLAAIETQAGHYNPDDAAITVVEFIQ